MNKQKLLVEQRLNPIAKDGDGYSYVVLEARNLLSPRVEEVLGTQQVQQLIDSGVDVRIVFDD